jgi:prevent-host-death family protein
MTTTVGAYEAKTHLPRLLDDVAHGSVVVITKHGKPVAKLVPYAEPHREDRRRVFEEMRALAASVPPWTGVSYRELIDEGRDLLR